MLPDQGKSLNILYHMPPVADDSDSEVCVCVYSSKSRSRGRQSESRQKEVKVLLQPQHRSDLKHGFPLYSAIALLVVTHKIAADL